jgi:hypothetical protein
MSNLGQNYYGLFFQDGNPQGMNEAVLQYPGHLGMIAPTQCHDGITRQLQIVQTDSVMGTAPQEGALAYWANEDQFRVTTDDAVAGFGLGRCIGVFTTVVTLGYYTAIVKKGRKTNVWFVDAPTAAPTGAGLLVIPTTTDGRADALAAGSAATYPPIGRTSGTVLDAALDLAECDVDVYGGVW